MPRRIPNQPCLLRTTDERRPDVLRPRSRRSSFGLDGGVPITGAYRIGLSPCLGASREVRPSSPLVGVSIGRATPWSASLCSGSRPLLFLDRRGNRRSEGTPAGWRSDPSPTRLAPSCCPAVELGWWPTQPAAWWLAHGLFGGSGWSVFVDRRGTTEHLGRPWRTVSRETSASRASSLGFVCCHPGWSCRCCVLSTSKRPSADSWLQSR